MKTLNSAIGKTIPFVLLFESESTDPVSDGSQVIGLQKSGQGMFLESFLIFFQPFSAQ